MSLRGATGGAVLGPALRGPFTLSTRPSASSTLSKKHM
jgi:hypothetical protein